MSSRPKPAMRAGKAFNPPKTHFPYEGSDNRQKGTPTWQLNYLCCIWQPN